MKTVYVNFRSTLCFRMGFLVLNLRDETQRVALDAAIQMVLTKGKATDLFNGIPINPRLRMIGREQLQGEYRQIEGIDVTNATYSGGNDAELFLRMCDEALR